MKLILSKLENILETARHNADIQTSEGRIEEAQVNQQLANEASQALEALVPFVEHTLDESDTNDAAEVLLCSFYSMMGSGINRPIPNFTGNEPNPELNRIKQGWMEIALSAIRLMK